MYVPFINIEGRHQCHREDLFNFLRYILQKYWWRIPWIPKYYKKAESSSFLSGIWNDKTLLASFQIHFWTSKPCQFFKFSTNNITSIKKNREWFTYHTKRCTENPQKYYRPSDVTNKKRTLWKYFTFSYLWYFQSRTHATERKNNNKKTRLNKTTKHTSAGVSDLTIFQMFAIMYLDHIEFLCFICICWIILSLFFPFFLTLFLLLLNPLSYFHHCE